MNEVKKIFGLLLIATCLHYTHMIVPELAYSVITIIVLGFFGGYYLYKAVYTKERGIRIFQMLMSVGLLATAGAHTVITIKNWFIIPTTPHATVTWHTNAHEALEEARRQHKKLLYDFSASWCATCRTLEKKIISDATIQKTLSHVIPVMVDCSQQTAETCAYLSKKFEVTGFPRLILYDVDRDTVLGSWSSEIIEQGPAWFAQELEQRL